MANDKEKLDPYVLRFMTGLGIANPLDLHRFQYAGGRNGRHANYWKLMFGDKPFPERQIKCVCGHLITENCYIMDETGKIYVVGNKCIKRYLLKEKSGRTCEKCKAPHKNRTVNLCKKCR
jgi:hypothetical protein